MNQRLLPLFLCFAAACNSAKGSSSGGSAGTATETPPGGDAEAPGASSGAVGTPIGSKGKLGNVSFRNVGRTGTNLRIHVIGEDPTKQTSAAHLRFTDEADQPVPVVDSDWDGISDASEGTFRFETSTLGQATFEGEVLLRSLYKPTSKVKKVFVALEDEKGKRTAETAANLELQTVAHAGDTCDVAKLSTRCATGLSCSGTPPRCEGGVAPTLANVAYFGGADPRMLFRGADPDEDFDAVEITFLDNANNPKEVILTGDSEDGTSASAVTIDGRAGAFGSLFVVETQPNASFALQVPKIGAVAKDAVGRTSARTIVARTTAVVKKVGQGCDPDGFDTCTATTVCAPGFRSAVNTCKLTTAVQREKCKSAPALDPSAGPARAYGVAEGVSVWDAPTGCVGNDAVGRPEAAVPLTLKTAAKTLTITTALPETSFDTAVYLLPGCAATSAEALGCNDDERGYSSTLRLRDVPAGNYTIVVESVQMRGGRFGVSVTAE